MTGLMLRMVLLTGLMIVLTGCCLFHQQSAVLQGNTIQPIYSSASNGSRVLTSYRIGPEALERLLEQAERK